MFNLKIRSFTLLIIKKEVSAKPKEPKSPFGSQYRLGMKRKIRMKRKREWKRETAKEKKVV